MHGGLVCLLLRSVCNSGEPSLCMPDGAFGLERKRRACRASTVAEMAAWGPGCCRRPWAGGTCSDRRGGAASLLTSRRESVSRQMGLLGAPAWTERAGLSPPPPPWAGPGPPPGPGMHPAPTLCVAGLGIQGKHMTNALRRQNLGDRMKSALRGHTPASGEGGRALLAKGQAPAPERGPCEGSGHWDTDRSALV